MAEEPRKGGNTALAFVVGGLLVLVAVVGWVVLTGQGPQIRPPETSVDVDVKLPDAPKMPEAPDPQPLPAPTPAKPG